MPLEILSKISSEPSLAAKQDRAAQMMTSQIQSTYFNIISSQKGIFNTVWKNQQGLAPQQVMDALGTKAAEIFIIGANTVDFINKLDPTKLTPNDYLPLNEITINPDGTVTILPEPNKQRVALGLVK